MKQDGNTTGKASHGTHGRSDIRDLPKESVEIPRDLYESLERISKDTGMSIEDMVKDAVERKIREVKRDLHAYSI